MSEMERGYLDLLAELVIHQDAEGRVIWANKAAGDSVGETPEKLVGRYCYEIWHNRDCRCENCPVQEAIETGEDKEGEIQGLDGRWWLIRATPIKNDEGKVEGAVEITLEITDRKLKERALEESEARYLSVFNQKLNCIYIHDFEGNFIDANEAVLDLLGYSRQEIKAMNLSSVVHEDSLHRAYRSLQEIINTGSKKSLTEYKLKTKSGDTVWILTQGSLIYREGKPDSVLGFAVDITKREKMEEALRESEEKYRTLIEALPHMVGIFQQGRMVFANTAFLEMFGYESMDEAIGMNEAQLVSEDERKRITDYTRVRLRGESEAPEHYTTVLKRKNGDVFPAEVFVKQITYEGQPAQQVIAQDITDRKRAEEALRESEEMYRGVVEASPDGIVYMDTGLNMVMANRQAAALHGYEHPEEMVGKNGIDLIAPEDRERAKETARKRLEGLYVGPSEYKMFRRDGNEFLAEFNSVIIRNARGEPKGYMAVVRDITERRKMEEELLKAAKLESLGILAGGIAHDFNNILTAILGNINLVSVKAKLDDVTHASLREAEKACYRAKGLTSQLLTFSKGGAPVRKAASIGELLTDTINFTVSGSNVRAVFDIADDLWPVEIDETQMSQALNNLAVNSIHAMPQGGVITVKAKNEVIDENSHPLKGGRYVKISIKDEGMGIPDNYIDKIFDPYFTTKQKGSGLGLATGYSVINRHGGYIFVDSELGKGTVFTIYLPATEKKPHVEPRKPSEIRRGRGRILLMDDEEIIRRVGKELIEGLGYEVETASDGAEAIELYKRAMEEERPIDVVITDLTVPDGMGGRETVTELLKLDPNARVIVSSGYSSDHTMGDYEQYGFKGVIAKPYNMRQMGEVLYEVMSEL